ncbi:MAG: phosphomannomutase/phosphoglucomutase [Nanoarchaeota archaeon]
MGIFKAYDIRGIYPSELDENTAYKVGRAMVVFLKAKTILVAHDCRLSGPSLTKEVIRGVTDQGADVIEVGLTSSPMFYFCVGKTGVDAGIMVTASHNTKEYNGFKLARKDAVAISGDTGIKDIESIVLAGKFPHPVSKGKVTSKDMISQYTDHVLKFAKDIKRLKIVADAGNGMGGLVMPPIFSRTPIEVVPVWFELDGNFPNRDPNPSKEENIKVLLDRVKAEKADLGIAFDGDGDRVIFVDEKGESLRGDLATALIADEIASRQKSVTVLYDLRSSRAVKEHLDKAGIKSMKIRVGHSFIKAAMRKEDANFAGELSGHFYFKDHYYCDSDMVASMLMLSLLSRTGKKLSELSRPLRKYPSTGEVSFTVKDGPGAMQELISHFNDARIDKMDGVTCEYDDWWVNVRPSNTEPLVRMIIEAKDQKTLDAKRAEVEKIIRRFM